MANNAGAGSNTQGIDGSSIGSVASPSSKIKTKTVFGLGGVVRASSGPSFASPTKLCLSVTKSGDCYFALDLDSDTGLDSGRDVDLDANLPYRDWVEGSELIRGC